MTEQTFICEPCTVEPGDKGSITIPGKLVSTVWCPWCGDKMHAEEDLDYDVRE